MQTSHRLKTEESSEPRCLVNTSASEYIEAELVTAIPHLQISLIFWESGLKTVFSGLFTVLVHRRTT